MLICQKCFTQNKDYSKFCKNCGGLNLYDPDAEIKKKKAEEERKRQEEQRAVLIQGFKDFFFFALAIILIFFVSILINNYLDNKGCMNGDDALCVKVAKKQKDYNLANKFYEKSCELNNLESCWYLLDKGGTKDENYYLDKICEYGENSYDVCLNQAKSYEAQNNHTQANIMYQKACEKGSDFACEMLTCKLGNVDKCFNAAKTYQNSNDYQNSNEFLKKGCDLGSGTSCGGLGYNYGHGNGFVKDIDKANELYKKACDLGSGYFCGILGYSYQVGDGVTKDINKANKLFKKGCDLDDGISCGILALNYEFGDGVIKDINKANKIYEKGCNLDNGGSCLKLGLNHEKEKGLHYDIEKIKYFYQKGCDLENDSSCIFASGLNYDKNSLGYTAFKSKEQTIKELESYYLNSDEGSDEYYILKAMLQMADENGYQKYKDEKIKWNSPGNVWEPDWDEWRHIYDDFEINMFKKANGSIVFDTDDKNKIPKYIYDKFFMYGDYAKNYIGKDINIDALIAFLKDVDKKFSVNVFGYRYLDDEFSFQNLIFDSIYVENKECMVLNVEEKYLKILKGKDAADKVCADLLNDVSMKKLYKELKPRRYKAMYRVRLASGYGFEDVLTGIECETNLGQYDWAENLGGFGGGKLDINKSVLFLEILKDYKNSNKYRKNCEVLAGIYHTGVVDRSGYYIQIAVTDDCNSNIIISDKHASNTNMNNLEGVIQCSKK